MLTVCDEIESGHSRFLGVSGHVRTDETQESNEGSRTSLGHVVAC